MILNAAILRVVLSAITVSCVGSAVAAENHTTDLRKSIPYYYTGYYQYGSKPYVGVSNFAIARGSSYLFSPYSYGYNPTGFYGTPNVKRAWSLGYLSNGHSGAYYY